MEKPRKLVGRGHKTFLPQSWVGWAIVIVIGGSLTAFVVMLILAIHDATHAPAPLALDALSQESIVHGAPQEAHFVSNEKEDRMCISGMMVGARFIDKYQVPLNVDVISFYRERGLREGWKNLESADYVGAYVQLGDLNLTKIREGSTLTFVVRLAPDRMSYEADLESGSDGFSSCPGG